MAGIIGELFAVAPQGKRFQVDVVDNITDNVWHDIVTADDAYAAKVQGLKIAGAQVGRYIDVTVSYMGENCPACGQVLTVTDGVVECGGEGEGGCDESCEGSARCIAANDRAAQAAVR